MSNSNSNKDYFSNHSKIYSLNRPSPPKELFEYLLKFTKGRDLAWDVATGNGQAAVEISKYFKKVIATDLSSGQIAQAQSRPNIHYHVEPCEKLDSELVPFNSVDLITIAVAIHWFPFDQFYERVNKVLKPDGVIAAWVYWHPKVTPEIDATHAYIEKNFFEKYDPPETDHCKSEYSTIPWPFKKPEGHIYESDGVNRQFSFKKELKLTQYCDYLRTRSSAQLYLEDVGKDAIEENYEALLKAWGGDPEILREVTWNLKLLVGVKE